MKFTNNSLNLKLSLPAWERWLEVLPGTAVATLRAIRFGSNPAYLDCKIAVIANQLCLKPSVQIARETFAMHGSVPEELEAEVFLLAHNEAEDLVAIACGIPDPFVTWIQACQAWSVVDDAGVPLKGAAVKDAVRKQIFGFIRNGRQALVREVTNDIVDSVIGLPAARVKPRAA